MRLSTEGRNLIKGFEGLMLTAYPDGGGYSIGYGHHGVAAGTTIDRAEADRLFDQDAVKFEMAVQLAVPSATQQQFDAMTSLAYNIGTQAFRDSTLVKRHNAGDFEGAASEFLRWNKSQGNVLPVLVSRRAKESAIYRTGFAPYAPQNQSPAPAPVGPDEPDRSGAVLAAVGLVFFCPCCGGRLRAVADGVA